MEAGLTILLPSVQENPADTAVFNATLRPGPSPAVLLHLLVPQLPIVKYF